ncbi:MAG TPA: methyltransferase dimerization domain-containing protein, partial [Candidatus Binataceae bacterium]
MATQSSDPSASTLLDLIAGHRVTAVIHVAAKLGIADLLFEGPKTAAELSRMTDTHPRSLLRLMRGLVALAICTEAADGSYSLTEVGTYLAAKSERSLKAWVLLEGEMLRPGWIELIESIRLVNGFFIHFWGHDLKCLHFDALRPGLGVPRRTIVGKLDWNGSSLSLAAELPDQTFLG